ncbi:calcium-transporting ATPase 12, plasma membrane-type-like [Ziziphus jujuba]|uniref:Calcium-transporting ATPase 12, plasma membrane-type-like n=1 Tax=Ziziphus jujuba TaxID=326968 RepID=A0ABM4A3W8_ZIZJJ|nr:calcium-transporting ATPase 12, plasma membrane-type-like [Ziziphus jujuba]
MKIVKEKDLDRLKKLPNGVESVAKTLETDIKTGSLMIKRRLVDNMRDLVQKHIKSHLRRSKVRNSSENQIEVLRGNKRKKISMYEIVVGDVVCLKIGDEVPADGLLVEGNNLQVEEDDQDGETVQVDPDKNPFLFSGSIVVNSD